MQNQRLNRLNNEWSQAIYTVLAMEKESSSELQRLLLQTYEVLSELCSEQLVPKETCKLFLEMEDFLYFSSLIEANESGEGFYCHRQILDVVKALENGFLDGCYEYAFPKLVIGEGEKSILFNLEKDDLSLV